MKRAEKAIPQSEECYRLLVENAPLGILTCDVTGKIVTINQKVLDLVGSPSMDFTRSVNLLTFPPLVDAGIAGDFAACISTARTVTSERHYVSQWNKSVFIRYYLTPISDDEGTVTGVQGIFEDVTEIKRAEEALRRSEASFRTLFENAGTAIVVVDTETGSILDCNSITEKLVGLEREEIVGMVVTRLHPPGDSEKIGGSIRTDARQGHIVSREAEVLHGDGRRIPVIINATPLEINGTSVIMGLLFDITERKRTEEALRQSEEQFRALAETASVAICILQDGQLRYINPAMEKISGYTKEELQSIGFMKLVHPDALAYVTSRYRDWLGGSSDEAHSEIKCLRKDGEVRWADLSRSTISYQGKPAILLTGIDTTERHRAEEALRESEDRFKAVFNRTAMGLAITDPTGLIIDSNSAYQEMVGYSKDELRAIRFLDITYPDDISKNRALQCQLYDGLIDTYQLEKRYVRKDGQVIWCNLVASAIRNPDGTLKHNLAVAEDITRRKQAEEALRESEKRLQLCCATARLGTFDWDLINDRHVWSPETFRIYGLPPDTHLTGKLINDIIYPGDRLDSVLEAGLDPAGPGEYTMEYRIRRASDRTVRWVYMMTRVIFEGEGKMRRAVRVLGAIQDITERKQAENALRISERFLNNVLDSITDGISVLDRDLNIIRVNRTMERWHPDTLPLVGKKCYVAYHCRPEPCAWCPSLKAISEKESRISVVPRDMEGKTVGWQEVHSYPLHGDDGHVIGVIDYVRDITERKLTEDALRESEETFRVLAEASSAMIWLYQGDHFIYINGAGERLTGYTIEELLRMKFWDVVHPDDRDLVRDRGLARQRGEPVPGKYEVKLLTRDGDTRRAELTAGRILYRGQPAGIATFFDITERKQAEEQLASAMAESELYLDLMGHDINNMNLVTMGYIEVAYHKLVSEGTLTSADFSLLEKALKSVQNSSNLIRNVQKLQWTRLGLYVPEVLDLGETIEEVVAQHGNVPGREVHINSALEHGSYVRANALLKDVFINLVGNAIKHSDGPLEINIRMSKESVDDRAYWTVTVEDNGPGMPDSQKKILFDRLSLSASRARGKGFGLCLIKMLIDNYCGRFQVEDRVPGDYRQGARFIVMLPAA